MKKKKKKKKKVRANRLLPHLRPRHPIVLPLPGHQASLSNDETSPPSTPTNPIRATEAAVREPTKGLFASWGEGFPSSAPVDGSRWPRRFRDDPSRGLELERVGHTHGPRTAGPRTLASPGQRLDPSAPSTGTLIPNSPESHRYLSI